MTIEELEKYCVKKAAKCRKESDKYEKANMLGSALYCEGQAQAYVWIAAVIQQNKPRVIPH